VQAAVKLAGGHFWPADVGVWLMQYFPLSCLEVMSVVVPHRPDVDVDISSLVSIRW
jgi:hypothetical protein